MRYQGGEDSSPPFFMTEPQKPAAFSGLRILDLSRILAGPTATQHLADLGAEVIKIERPGRGDDTRGWGPPFLKDVKGRETRESAYYLSSNRGKYSVTVDIATPQGQSVIRRMAENSDVLVDNFKLGDLDGKGLGYRDFRKLNPELIYCSISGFGRTGPNKHRAGYDFLIQGEGGLISDWMQVLEAAGVPAGPINSQMRVRMAHKSADSGFVELIGNPLKLSETPVHYAKHPPRLGQDTVHVLKTLFNFSDQDIAMMRGNGTLGKEQ